MRIRVLLIIALLCHVCTFLVPVLEGTYKDWGILATMTISAIFVVTFSSPPMRSASKSYNVDTDMLGICIILSLTMFFQMYLSGYVLAVISFSLDVRLMERIHKHIKVIDHFNRLWPTDNNITELCKQARKVIKL